MLVLAIATAGLEALLPALTACGALSAAIFTALRFNRDDATAVVNQHKEVLAAMKSLNDELQEALERSKAEHAETRNQLAAVLDDRVGAPTPGRKARR